MSAPVAFAGEFVTREDTCEVICRLANDIYTGSMPCVEDFCCWTAEPPQVGERFPQDPAGSQWIRDFTLDHICFGVDLHIMTGWTSQTR